MTFPCRLRSFSYAFSVLLLLCFFPSNAMSIEEVVIGQDAILTTGNIVQVSGDAGSNGTDAYARVLANPGTDSISMAQAGTEIKIIGYEGGPESYLAKLTFEFEYSLTVNYSGGGSADTHINASFSSPELYPDFNERFYDRINFIYSAGSDQKGRIIKLQNALPISLKPGNRVNADISLYAHAGVWEELPTALSYASANLRSVTIDFLPPPVATFSYLPAKPILGDAITFDASESVCPEDGDSICQYFWDLGDGETATGEFVSHQYSKIGTYYPSLTLVDSYGQENKFPVQPISLTFRPKPVPSVNGYVFTSWLTNLGGITPPGPLHVMIGNYPTATADLVLGEAFLESNDENVFIISRDGCARQTIKADGSVCDIEIGVIGPAQDVAILNIPYEDINSASLRIPLEHKIVGAITEEGRVKVKDLAELTVDLYEHLKDEITPIPENINIPPGLPNYQPLGGNIFHFMSNNSSLPACPLVQVSFADELSFHQSASGIDIPVLPYMVYKNNQVVGDGGVTLVNYLDLQGGNGWFISVDEDFHDISGVPIKVLDLTFFQVNSGIAEGYNCTVQEADGNIISVSTLQGSANIKNIFPPFRADYDNDFDLDGIDLSAFRLKWAVQNEDADLNFDGKIDNLDILIFNEGFGLTCP